MYFPGWNSGIKKKKHKTLGKNLSNLNKVWSLFNNNVSILGQWLWQIYSSNIYVNNKGNWVWGLGTQCLCKCRSITILKYLF